MAVTSGAGFDEKVPEPAAVNDPFGYAWLPTVVVTPKFGVSEERLNEATSSVVEGLNVSNAEFSTSWLRLPAVALAVKLAFPLPIFEVSCAPVVEGEPVTEKIPESKLAPRYAPAASSVKVKLPAYPACVNPSPGPQLTAQLPSDVLVAVRVKRASCGNPLKGCALIP